MGVYNPLGNSQPHAGALGGEAMLPSPEKSLEDPAPLVLRNARPAIGYANYNLPTLLFG